MKARPRSVERQVASHLSEMSLSLGCSKVERIPILGREGPDITTNELGLVIDVKSRLACPGGYFWSRPLIHGDLVAIELDTLLGLPEIEDPQPYKFSSITVNRWYDHMDEWTKEFMPSGISALVLHKPKMPIGKGQLLFHVSNLEVLKCRLRQMLLSTNPVRM